MKKTFSFLIATIIALTSLGIFAQFPSFHKENNVRQIPANVPAVMAVSKQFEIKSAAFRFIDKSPPAIVQSSQLAVRTKPKNSRDYHYAVFYPPEKRE